tara:strand:- start:60 stop:851 length:792 start_codon:yes stop_codon:yes gene_type:complete
MLSFSDANAKIEALKQVEELQPYLEGKRKVYSFDLLSGFSCPFAEKCLSKAVLIDGKRKIKDGPKTEFRCFSASQEVQYNGVYNKRKKNYDNLKLLNDGANIAERMAEEIDYALPQNAGIVRIHVAGDFFNAEYFRAWMIVASMNPTVLFYAYTKSLQYWVDNLDFMPYNMVMTASRGGRLDYLIEQFNLRETVVVFSESEAEEKNLIIDHDDSHAARPSLKGNDFALLIHGTQPKGSEAANALKILKRDKIKHSYSRKKVTV